MPGEPEVLALVEDLLGRCDPRSARPEDFLGAQFDAGLAWVHFDAGLGGLGMFAAVLSQIFRNHAEHRIAASQVEAIENRRAMAPALAPGAPT